MMGGHDSYDPRDHHNRRVSKGSNHFSRDILAKDTNPFLSLSFRSSLSRIRKPKSVDQSSILSNQYPKKQATSSWVHILHWPVFHHLCDVIPPIMTSSDPSWRNLPYVAAWSGCPGAVPAASPGRAVPVQGPAQEEPAEEEAVPPRRQVHTHSFIHSFLNRSSRVDASPKPSSNYRLRNQTFHGLDGCSLWLAVLRFSWFNGTNILEDLNWNCGQV